MVAGFTLIEGDAQIAKSRKQDNVGVPIIIDVPRDQQPRVTGRRCSCAEVRPDSALGCVRPIVTEVSQHMYPPIGQQYAIEQPVVVVIDKLSSQRVLAGG